MKTFRIRPVDYRLIGLVLGLVCAGMVTPRPALAWQGRVSFTTWLRAGPGQQYVVMDEIFGGDAIEIIGCQDGWCQTLSDKAIAYIKADLVGKLDSPRAPPPAAGLSCFPAQEAGYGKGEQDRFCPK